MNLKPQKNKSSFLKVYGELLFSHFYQVCISKRFFHSRSCHFTFGSDCTVMRAKHTWRKTTYSVKVGIRVIGHVVVEHNVHSLDIHTTAKEVCANQDALFEVLELLVTLQPTPKEKEKKDRVKKTKDETRTSKGHCHRAALGTRLQRTVILLHRFGSLQYLDIRP